MSSIFPGTPKALIVDDEEIITTVLSGMLGMYGIECDTANDPYVALDMLSRKEYDFMMTDIRMPGMSGLDLLQRCTEKYPHLPVIMISAVGTAEAAIKALKLGAADFISKPFDQDEIIASISNILNRPEPKIEQLFGVTADYEPSFIAAMNMVATILDQVEMDSYVVPGHSTRVANAALSMGKALSMSHDEIVELVVAARLHDIGKVFLPCDLRRKPATELTIQEQARYENHPVIGERMTGDLSVFKKVPQIIRHHHERFDGKGFPDAIKGQRIPLESRIISVLEVYDAIKFSRANIHEGVETEALAITYLRNGVRSLFDKDVVDVYIGVLKQK